LFAFCEVNHRKNKPTGFWDSATFGIETQGHRSGQFLWKINPWGIPKCSNRGKQKRKNSSGWIESHIWSKWLSVTVDIPFKYLDPNSPDGPTMTTTHAG
jgi:hypothetical protein